MIVFNFAITRDGHRQLNESSHKLSIDFLGPLCVDHAGCVKKQLPVDRVLTRHRTKSQEIRKERHGISLQVQLVAVANLRMTVPIGCVGKLKRYKSAMRWTKPLRAFSKYLIYKRLSDERGQKLMKNDPLVVPAQQPGRFVEHAVVRCFSPPHFVNERVMGLEHGEMQL